MALSKEDLLAISELMETKLDLKLEPLKRDVSDLKKDVDGLKRDVDGLKTDVNGLKIDVNGLKTDIKSIQLTIENETNKNINIIAEGHSILNRKLDEALKVESEKELLLLRMNYLENEIRRVKERLDQIA